MTPGSGLQEEREVTGNYNRRNKETVKRQLFMQCVLPYCPCVSNSQRSGMVAVVRHQRTGIGRLKQRQRAPRCLQYSDVSFEHRKAKADKPHSIVAERAKYLHWAGTLSWAGCT